MKLNFTQKAYLSGAVIYLILITGMLSVFQPSDSIRTSISKENNSNTTIDKNHHYVLDTEIINDESIIPFLSSPIEVNFMKFNPKRTNSSTKL
jgi:hypothetical protein